MVKTVNSFLQHREIAASDIRLSCATRGHSNYHKVGLLSLAGTFPYDQHRHRLSYQESNNVICTARFTQALIRHSVIILDDEIERLG